MGVHKVDCCRADAPFHSRVVCPEYVQQRKEAVPCVGPLVRKMLIDVSSSNGRQTVNIGNYGFVFRIRVGLEYCEVPRYGD